MRYKLTLEYDGTPYYGFQKQGDLATVQKSLENALGFLTKNPSVWVAGRTDKGVHAWGQVVHVDLEKSYDPWVLRQALNAHLREESISVLQVEEVCKDFHARFNAVSKTYVYRIINQRPPIALEKNRAWHVILPLHKENMKHAASHLMGTHDFSSFRAQGCQSASPIKTLDEVSIISREALIEVSFKAKSFLYHQVRNMIGALCYVGLNHWEPCYIKTVLEKKNRCHGAPTAPACGLYLKSVEFES